ncbi:unnamed protein product, partial [Mesorhabditis belari]|uniref:NECAP PHear domain-containing protein n=1 Tax=Mesorhabditis belari TaxID=2138241 RepID=A0AAF3FG27_9BILA
MAIKVLICYTFDTWAHEPTFEGYHTRVRHLLINDCQELAQNRKKLDKIKMAEYESVALVKPEVFVYRIPPLTTNRGYKAAEWNLDTPDWTGRLRLVSIGKKLEVRLEDRASGQLYAKAPIESYPGVGLEPVSDSSRYFALRLMNETGQTAFVGIGFSDRGDSFDLNVALQDHFKYLEKAAELEQQSSQPTPQLDLGFKEGQTITINIGKKKDNGGPSRPRPAANSGGGFPLLPPPPGPGQPAKPRGTPTSNSPVPPQTTSNVNLLDF